MISVDCCDLLFMKIKKILKDKKFANKYVGIKKKKEKKSMYKPRNRLPR